MRDWCWKALEYQFQTLRYDYQHTVLPLRRNAPFSEHSSVTAKGASTLLAHFVFSVLKTPRPVLQEPNERT